MAETQSLAPAWLSFPKELPASSQEKVNKPPVVREKHNKKFVKQNSLHHLSHTAPAHPSLMSANWRNSDLNPRVLNRSKSSPVFDLLKEKSEPPKSPDRSSSSYMQSHAILSQSPERSPVLRASPLKMRRPALVSSRSSPNLLNKDLMTSWQQQKLTTTRSPPSSRSSSFVSSAPAPLAPAQPAVVAPATQQTSPPAQGEEGPKSDTEIEKLRALVPAPAVAPLPKPPSRLVNNRKTAHPKPQEKPKKPLPLAAVLKKASSEPSLFAPGSPEDLARRAKIAKNTETAKLKETVEGKEYKTNATRGNFFKDIIKMEKQLQDSSEDELDPITASGGASDSSSDEGKGGEECISSSSRRSPPITNKDDEEKFLRLLGWVPDEEDHVPELDENEIAEVRLRLKPQGSSFTNSPLRNMYPTSVHKGPSANESSGEGPYSA